MEEVLSIPDAAPGWGEDIYPLLSWCRMENLKKAKVMVVGSGALGNEVLKDLALFGVGHIVLVDFDTIEPSNLTRSILFSHKDAREGRYKAEVAAERIEAINPDIQTLPIVGDITHDVGLGLLRRMDVVIGCLDNRWARYCLNRMCMRAEVPWVDGGIDGLEGTCRVFMPGKNCYACSLGPEALKDLKRRMSCSTAIRRNEKAQRAATTPVVASIIGAVQTQEAIKLLHPEQLASGELVSMCGKMFYYEGQRLSTRMVDFEAWDDDCPVHESWTPVVKTGLTRELTVTQTLQQLRQILDCEEVEISLREHGFVDYLTKRTDGRKYMAMRPNHEIEHFVEGDEELRFVPLYALYQHEVKKLDASIPPYMDVEMEKLGIPAWEVLTVNTEKGTFYVEWADELCYKEKLS